MATPAPNPIHSSITADLERGLREIQTSSHTGPPGDLDDNKKRWLGIGICLHSILSPALRIYVDPVVTNLYSALLLSDQIDKQIQPTHLRTYGAAKTYLNYEAINNNKTTHGYRTVLWDYKVYNAVDLSKLFLQPYMAHYTAFDGSCDSSALFGMINKIDKFPVNAQTAANDVRSTVRNDWAHCNFSVWDDVKYVQSLQQIENLIYLLNLNAADEKEIIEELDKWRKNGTSFLQGSTISFELGNEIRQQIHILLEYAEVISKTADTEFGKVHEALINMRETFSQYGKRISTLENTVATQGKTLKESGSPYDADIPEIERWKQNSKDFIKTDIFTDILGIIKDNHCVLLTGVSGMGKTLTAQNIALQLCQVEGYSIVPCNTVKDIKKRYKDNVRQVFFVDDICGKYTANIKYIENWMRIKDFVNFILCKGLTKILATCRTEIVKQENVKETLTTFLELFDLTKNYSIEDKMKLARNHLKVDEEMLTDIVKKVEFSPLLCFLYSKHDGFDVNEFLNSPLKTFSDEWDTLKTFDKEKLCVLLLSVVYNGTINETMFDVLNDLDKEEKRKLKVIFECCNLGRDTPRSAIKDKLNACVGTYFTKEDREYKVIHDKMFDFLCDYFGKALIAPILKYADDKLISERVQLESIQKAHAEFTIIVTSTDEQKYIDRVKMDLKNGKIHWCLNNVQMRYKEYREKLLDVMKDLDDEVKKRCIDIKDENGINAFIISCMRGYEELIDLFISVGADVNAQNGWFTPLTAACREGHLRIVEILLDKGSNINQTNKNGETPIYTACFGGHFSLAKLLIEKHADINKRNKFHRKPLYVCCLSGHKSIVQLLIDKGANVNESSESLIVAVHGSHDQIVEKLISNGCCLNSVDTKSKTALFIACEIGNTTITKLLIDKNADIYKVDSDGRTPLHAACCVANNDIVRMLINKKSDVNMLDVDLETPLHKACRKGSEEVILTLLDNGADTKQTSKDGHTPVYLAKTKGKIVNENILKCLGDKGIVPNEGLKTRKSTKDKLPKKDDACTTNYIEDGWTPLYEACVHGDIETFQSLIRYRADVNMQTISGDMPLVAACQHGHGLLIQTLLDEKADINQALVFAIQKDYDRAVKILLYKGGNIGYKTVDGKSLIKLACEHGSIKAIKILSEKGADLTEIDVNGSTLIHVACNTDSVELLQFLIDKGLDLDIPDKNGRYALFVSIYKGLYNLSKYLVQKSCPITISEEDTKTILISVFESGNREMSKLLVSNGYTDKLSDFKETMLYHAYKLGIYEKVENLCKYGANIKETYKYGYTPVILADIGGNDMLSENLQNAICSTAFIRDNLILNKSIRIVYNSDKEVDDRIRKRYDYDTETERSWKLQQYEDLFHACMFGIIKPLFRVMLQGTQLDIFFQPRNYCGSIWFEQTPLCLAIRRGHTEVVKLLLRHCVNVNLTFEEWKTKNDVSLSTTIRYGYTPLFAACQRKYYEIVDLLLKRGANLNKALYDACREGFFETVKFLLRKEANVNSIGRYGHTALYGACIGGNISIVNFLIDQGSVVGTRVQRRNISDEITCLHAAYVRGNHDIVQLLINRGASVDLVCNFGRTLLHKACRHGNYKIAEKLMDKGVDMNASDLRGSTPLIACVLPNIEDNYEEHHFDRHMRTYDLYENFVQTLDVDLETPLHKACRQGSEEVILTLLYNGADTKQTNKDGHTPVYLAKTKGKIVNEIILKCLGDKEIVPNEGLKTRKSTKDKLPKKDDACTTNYIEDGWTPLYEACVHGDIETFQSLIRYRADVNMQTISGDMPLVAACQHGHGLLIQTLLDEKADINQALVCAIQKDYDRAVKILLYKGGNIGYKTVDGKSLIKLACEHGSIKAIKILSEKGADLTEIDVNGSTLIHVACNTDSVELLQFLIDKGLDLDIPDKNGRYALFVSIYKGLYNLSKYLVQKSCPITISEEDTKTILISVFESGNREMSKLLVSNGYTDKLSDFNETMLYHAYKLGIYEKVENLCKYGANIKETYKYGYTPVILADIGGNDMLSENLQNAICSTAFIRDNLILNKSIRIVYNSDKEVDDRIRKRYDYDTETERSWKLQQYEDLFHACMFGIIKPLFRVMLQGTQLDIFFQPRNYCGSIWFEQTPLCLAIRRGHTEVVKLLLRHCVNVNLTFEESKTKNDVSLSTTIRYGYTPLFAACQRKYYEIVDLLLERGANLNKALYDACREGFFETVKFLLQKEANVNSIGRYGHTALYGACIGGYFSIVNFLIDQGSVVDTRVQRTNISDEITCLHAAYVRGNHDIVQLLINRGASVDLVGNFGRTLLHKACRDGNYKIAEKLMDKGVDMNASDLRGSTPLIACILPNIEDNYEEHYFDRHMRTYDLYENFVQTHEDYPDLPYEYCDPFRLNYKLLTENHYKVIQLLIENGADINKADKRERTPLSLSRNIGDMKLTEMLLPKKLLPIEKNNVQE